MSIQFQNNWHQIKDIVYLITDVEQLERIVTAIMIRVNHTVLFELSCGNSVSWHYEFEITKTKDIKKQYNISQEEDYDTK